MSTTDSFILHESAKKYEWTGESFLSIKSFYSGEARYYIGNRQYEVSENNFLILNACTKYKIAINTVIPTESFCVFFSPEFVSNNFERDKIVSNDLLDEFDEDKLTSAFFERNHYHQGNISNLLHQGRLCGILKAKGIEREEYLQRILMALFEQNNDSFIESNNLSAKKRSTKEEIYRRVYYAKDFIDCNFRENLSLSSIADTANLSENHLLRNFKFLIGVTPFQYITRLKIARAVKQIRNSSISITQIANDLGYNSLGNFSYYFKSIVGVYPTELRKNP